LAEVPVGDETSMMALRTAMAVRRIGRTKSALGMWLGVQVRDRRFMRLGLGLYRRVR